MLPPCSAALVWLLPCSSLVATLTPASLKYPMAEATSTVEKPMVSTAFPMITVRRPPDSSEAQQAEATLVIVTATAAASMRQRTDSDIGDSWAPRRHSFGYADRFSRQQTLVSQVTLVNPLVKNRSLRKG